MESCLGHKLVILILFVDALKLSYTGPCAEVRVVAGMLPYADIIINCCIPVSSW